MSLRAPARNPIDTSTITKHKIGLPSLGVDPETVARL